MASSVDDKTEDSLLSRVKAQFVDFEEATIEYRDEAQLMRDYYDGIQWTDKEIKAIEARGQPVITDNKIKDKIETMLGVERQRRADPKAFPRNSPSDEQGAEAATDALRYVADDNMMQYARSDAAENMFVEGVGGLETTVQRKLPRKSKVPKVVVKHIRWDRQYWDPRSFKCDFSDAKYKGIVTWMDRDEAIAEFDGKEEIIDQSIDLGAQFESLRKSATTETFADKPRWGINTSGRKRVQVFDHHFIHKGQWWRCKFVAAGFVEEPAVSEYLDDEDEPQSSIEYQALYRQGRDGKPYGAIRRYKDLQDDWNKRRSKSTHLLNTNQIVMETGAAGGDPESVEKVRKEAARPDGVIESLPGMKLDIVKNLDLAQGHVVLMEQTGRALEATGPNAAIAGQTGSISGRAKELDAQGGLLAIDKPFDSIKYLSLRVYRQMWNRIQQFWKAETWIRVRDEEQLKFVPLNRTITRAELLSMEVGKQDIPDEEKKELLAQIAANPSLRETVKQNDVGQLDVDLILDESPDVMTLQQEEFPLIAELAKVRPDIPFEVVIEASSLRGDTKRKIKEGMTGENNPQAAAVAQLQQRMAELEALLKEAEVTKTAADAALTEAKAKETEVDAAIKATELLSDDAEPTTSISVN